MWSPRTGFICGLVVTLATVNTAAAFAKGDAHAIASQYQVNPGQSGCTWEPPVVCSPRYTYKTDVYMGCSTADSRDGNAWCSHTESYSGDWSSCSWKCDAVPEGTGTVVMPYANTWIPSGEEVSYLQDEANSAAKEQDNVAARQAELRKKFLEADQEYERAAGNAAETKRKADLATAFREEEKNRIDALPSLARMAQEESIREHQKRLEAEKQLKELRMQAAAAKDNDRSLDQIRAALTKQRLVNRIRAAEDARITAAAKDAAENARRELKRKTGNVQNIKAASLEANKSREEAARSANYLIGNATADLTGKVAQATAKASQEEQAVALAAQQYDFLKKQAERSAKSTIAVQRLAYEDRAKADAARMMYENYMLASEKVNASAEESSRKADLAVDNVTATRTEASATVTERTEAEKAALETADDALQALKDTAAHAGEISAKTEYAAGMSDLAPNSFLAGVATGMKNARSSTE